MLASPVFLITNPLPSPLLTSFSIPASPQPYLQRELSRFLALDTGSNSLQVRGATGNLRCHVHTILDLGGRHKILLQMRDRFQEQNWVAHRNMVEEHQMLMNLTHIPDVRDNRQPELARQQAHRKELGNTRDARAIDLRKVHAS